MKFYFGHTLFSSPHSWRLVHAVLSSLSLLALLVALKSLDGGTKKAEVPFHEAEIRASSVFSHEAERPGLLTLPALPSASLHLLHRRGLRSPSVRTPQIAARGSPENVTVLPFLLYAHASPPSAPLSGADVPRLQTDEQVKAASASQGDSSRGRRDGGESRKKEEAAPARGGAAEEGNEAENEERLTPDEVLGVPFWSVPRTRPVEEAAALLHPSLVPLSRLFLFRSEQPSLEDANAADFHSSPSASASTAASPRRRPAPKFFSTSLSSYLEALFASLVRVVPDVQLYNLPLRPDFCVFLPLPADFLVAHTRYGFKESHLGAAPVHDLTLQLHGKREICAAAAAAFRLHVNRRARDAEARVAGRQTEGENARPHAVRDRGPNQREGREQEKPGQDGGDARSVSEERKAELVSWLGADCESLFEAEERLSCFPLGTEGELPASLDYVDTDGIARFTWKALFSRFAATLSSRGLYSAALDVILPWTYTTDSQGRLHSASCANGGPLIPFRFAPDSRESSVLQSAGKVSDSPKTAKERTAFDGFLVEVCSARRGRSFDPVYVQLHFLFNLVFLTYPYGVAPVVFTVVESVLLAVVLTAVALWWLYGRRRSSAYFSVAAKDKSV
ncbi:hypothetical protein BESB_017300 [Besnoitia besnoiti]|uniref:Transmembrane protein n=1 Tax=Besnoitia besnoiti TaxID=94643 RepID=A0A2A9MAK0_BESBE|nr:hypothetical protein BESB_017300 [Besnoitia besnoiti]PFH32412.1 hypothetical protein BESB_017300 [Besnoitia besnoiti]